jgi:hypothetical protein
MRRFLIVLDKHRVREDIEIRTLDQFEIPANNMPEPVGYWCSTDGTLRAKAHFDPEFTCCVPLEMDPKADGWTKTADELRNYAERRRGSV